jgi:hypothetical protein
VKLVDEGVRTMAKKLESARTLDDVFEDPHWANALASHANTLFEVMESSIYGYGSERSLGERERERALP